MLLHQVLGETYAAHVLAFVYLLFLPMSPASLIVYLVWSRNISYGYWYATAQCLAWAFGTVSYYVLPTLGPNFAFPFIYADLDKTGVSSLQESLYNGRYDVVWSPLTTDSMRSAGVVQLARAEPVAGSAMIAVAIAEEDIAARLGLQHVERSPRRPWSARPRSTLLGADHRLIASTRTRSRPGG